MIQDLTTREAKAFSIAMEGNLMVEDPTIPTMATEVTTVPSLESTEVLLEEAFKQEDLWETMTPFYQEEDLMRETEGLTSQVSLAISEASMTTASRETESVRDRLQL